MDLNWLNGSNLAINSDMDQKHRYLVCMKDSHLLVHIRFKIFFLKGGLAKLKNPVHLVCGDTVQRGTCIKGLFWPPLEPKTESCFSPIPSYSFIRRIA